METEDLISLAMGTITDPAVMKLIEGISSGRAVGKSLLTMDAWNSRDDRSLVNQAQLVALKIIIILSRGDYRRCARHLSDETGKTFHVKCQIRIYPLSSAAALGLAIKSRRRSLS